jgi:uncharacterized protein (DUF58 family)
VSSQLVYRRKTSLVLGLVTIAAVLAMAGYLVYIGLISLALLLLLPILYVYFFLIRPRLVVRKDGLVVRNVFSTRITWDNLQAARVGRQEGYFARAWGLPDRGPEHDNWRTGGYYGLVLVRREGNPVAAFSVTDGRDHESTTGGRAVKAQMKTIAEEIQIGKQAAARGLDPIEAIESHRASSPDAPQS